MNNHSRFTSPSYKSTVLSAFPRRFVYRIDLLRELVVREIKLRYERSILGMLWAVLNPLAQLLVFTFVFQKIIQLDIDNYSLFVFTGVVAWNWAREALTLATTAIVDNRDLLKQPGFPLTMLPVVSVTTPLMDLLVALPLAAIFVVLGHGQLTAALIALPFVLGLQFLLLLGIGYVMAALQVLFRDTNHLLNVALMLGFYLTPVFYDAQQIPFPYRIIYDLNPMAHLITAYREILIRGTIPDWRMLLIIGLIGGGMIWGGRFVFTRTSYRFVEEL